MEQLAILWEPERRIFSVQELNAAIRALLEGQFSDIWVAGEISGCRTAPSGHCYFTLKDHEAQLQCVCFRVSLRRMKFKPLDGIAALARGHIDVYEARGQYQLLVEALEPQGHGALQLAFEQLKKKLSAEGLFDAARKRTLPKLPQRIGIVASPGGAVIRDILNVLGRRMPGLHIRLYPALVQGEDAIEQVCRGIEYFSESGWAEIVIVARGGGSLEDLWTFNEEAVARAIAASSIPLISAIGHETDFTIADFVADLRAPTPSAAAELAVCTREQLLEQIAGSERRLEQWTRYRVAMAGRRLHQQGIGRATTILHRAIGRGQQRVDDSEFRMRDRIRALLRERTRLLDERTSRLRTLDLRLRFAHARRRLDIGHAALKQEARRALAQAAGRLDPAIAHLTQLSPLKILDRGYAIVRNESGALVKQPDDAPVGSDISIRVAGGRLDGTVRRHG